MRSFGARGEVEAVRFAILFLPLLPVLPLLDCFSTAGCAGARNAAVPAVFFAFVGLEAELDDFEDEVVRDADPVTDKAGFESGDLTPNSAIEASRWAVWTISGLSASASGGRAAEGEIGTSSRRDGVGAAVVGPEEEEEESGSGRESGKESVGDS